MQNWSKNKMIKFLTKLLAGSIAVVVVFFLYQLLMYLECLFVVHADFFHTFHYYGSRIVSSSAGILTMLCWDNK